MLYMNDYDIEESRYRFSQNECPNLLTACQILDRLRRWVNANSDGWAYWSKPVRAAEKLMRLIQNADRWDPQDCTAAQLKAACTPIKSFLTKQGVDHALVFPALTPKNNYILVTETETITREYLVNIGDMDPDAAMDAARTTTDFGPLQKAPSRIVRLDRECDDVRPALADTKPTDYR